MFTENSTWPFYVIDAFDPANIYYRDFKVYIYCLKRRYVLSYFPNTNPNKRWLFEMEENKKNQHVSMYR